MSLQDEVREISKSQAVVGEQISSLGEKVDKVLYHLEGNGKPGLLIRVDRLERSKGLRSRFGWLVVASVVGAVGTVVVTKLFGG